MYQAGTLSGNPLAMSAGIAALELIRPQEVWESLEVRARQFEEGIAAAAAKAGLEIAQTRAGTMFSTFFMKTQPIDWKSVKQADTARFGRFFRGMLERGIYLAPSQFEAGFISTAHTGEIIGITVEAAEQALKVV
jgi:glutamate-1-semialdehyde 2,1-aminomutase